MNIKFTENWVTVQFRTKDYINLNENHNKIIFTVVTDKTKIRSNVFNIEC